MKSSHTLRMLDRVVGIPACLLLSGAYFFVPKPRDKRIKKVLVIELFEMGATIMLYPSLQYIKKNVKECELYCLTAKSIRSTWEMLGLVPKENIYTIDDTNLWSFIRTGLSAMARLRAQGMDLIIDYELFMRISSVMSGMIGAKFKAGFWGYEMEGLYKGDFYSQRCQFNQNTHIAKNFLGLTKTAVKVEHEYPNYKGRVENSELVVPTYKSNPAARKALMEKAHLKAGEKLILVSHDVGKNLSMRNYPRDSFVDVIRKLIAKYPKSRVLLIGTKGNRETASYIVDKVGDERCANFCGDTPVMSDLFELLSMSDLLITNDSGAAHFATATGTRTLALFSTDAPTMYGPLGNCVIAYSYYHCSPCISAYNHKESRCTNNLCLQAIKPNSLYEMAVKVMEDKLEYRTVNGLLKYV